MQVVHVAFTYLRLTTGKRGGYSERKDYKLSNVSNLVKIKPKHANSKIKFLSREIKN